MSNILVVGSLAYDSIQTPAGKVDRALGGSANYFSLAASLYSHNEVWRLTMALALSDC